MCEVVLKCSKHSCADCQNGSHVTVTSTCGTKSNCKNEVTSVNFVVDDSSLSDNQINWNC